MYVTRNVKKFIKDGKKDTLIYNKEQQLLCNGYMIIKVDEIVRAEIIKEFLQDTAFICKYGNITHDNINDLKSFLDIKDNECKIDMSNFIIENDIKGKLYTRVFFNEDIQVLIDRKYTDIIQNEELYNAKLYQYCIKDKADISPIYIYSNHNNFIGMILPIRSENERRYKLVKNDKTQ